MAPRILVVEDEAAVRILLNRYLTRAGFEAECTDSAESALDYVRRGQRYNAYVIDLTLPGMSGVDLARVILAQDEGANLILMSGYPYEAGEFDERRVVFLRKPFPPRELAAALGAVGG